MRSLPHLFDNNRKWARRITERDPDFFQSLAADEEWSLFFESDEQALAWQQEQQ